MYSGPKDCNRPGRHGMPFAAPSKLPAPTFSSPMKCRSARGLRSMQASMRKPRSIALHEHALDALSSLAAAAVISSRPVAFDGRLANEAFVLESNTYRMIHHKKYFPQEPGFFEEAWYVRGAGGFDCMQVGQVKVGVLLCTELFFNDRARAYGRDGADLIVTPRATGTSLSRWKTAGTMAAIVSGAWFVSSNRYGPGALGQQFGGAGFVVSPQGVLLEETSEATPMRVVTIDLDAARAQKTQYPCYVKEMP